MKIKAVYVTQKDTPNRGVVRYLLSIFNYCNFDEKEILYVENAKSLISFIINSTKLIKKHIDPGYLNLIFIRSAPIFDSLPPIIAKLTSNNNKVKVVAPLFHLNPLSFKRNQYDKSAFIFSVAQRMGALMEILFADVIVTESTYISSYIRKFRKSAHVIVKQLGMPREKIPDINDVLNSKRDIDFLYVGGLDKLKGIDHIIKAFSKIDNDKYTLVIAGYGDKTWIEKRIKKYGVKNVAIYTNLSEEEKFKLYLRSKVYVFASAADGIPITFHEAWAHGNIVVTYFLPTYIDVKDHIINVKYGDVDKLSQEMLNALRNYEKSKDFIIANYNYAVKMSINEERLREICEEIINYVSNG